MPASDKPVYIEVPFCKVISENNKWDHWSKKRKRRISQSGIVRVALKSNGVNVTLPCLIRLIRFGARKLDDDNLPGALKFVRDAVADWLIPGLLPGRADGDPRLKWEYEQIAGEPGVRIEIIPFVKDEYN